MKNNRVKVRRAMKRATGLTGLSVALLASTAALASGTALLSSALLMPDSLVAQWLVRPLAAVGVAPAGVSAGSGLPSSVGTSTSRSTPPPANIAVNPTKIGVNLQVPLYYNTVRAFANLAHAGRWRVQSKAGDPEASYFDAEGGIIKYNPNDNLYIILARPNELHNGKSVDIVCRWDGTGKLMVPTSGGAKNIVVRPNEARFTYVMHKNEAQLKVSAVTPSDPIRNLDCREPTMDPNALYDPAYVANLKRYSNLRFMDWQSTNSNGAVTWATRSRVGGKSNLIKGPDAFPIEWMIELANQTGVDPWFCMPWNADADYVRKFAELVRDKLDPKLTAYVEASNEVWNWAFVVATQASNEGLARGLSTNKQTALYYRYAEKTIEVMDIWTSVFAGQQKRIVRVAASHHALPGSFVHIMGFRDVATKVDAMASAPYFGVNLDKMTVDPNDLEPVFVALRDKIRLQLEYNGPNMKATAVKYGKRMITYEAGQHVTGDDVALNTAIQNDPRMAELYTHYLRYWQTNYGDLMSLYMDVGSVSKYGAWGMLEHAGQKPGSTPKSKAVTLFQASISK
jgi:hypothetical protein